MEDRMTDQIINNMVNEVEEQVQQAAPARKGPSLEENFERMRIRLAQLEREKEEEKRLRLEAEQRKNAASNFNIGDDDLVEGKHLSQVGKELQGMKEEMNYYRNQLLETRIRSNFPDYEAVVNEQTISQLQREHPELGQTLSATSDKYAQAASAYKLIKSLGIYENQAHASDRQRAQDNLNKPRPLTSVSPQTGEGPLSKANMFAEGLTPQLAAQLRKEMAQAIKNK